MALTQERKTQLIQTHKVHDTDTGSPEVQVAILTENIVNLDEITFVHTRKITIPVVVCLKWLDNVVSCLPT